MNWKLVVVGALVFYLVMLLLSFVTGPIIHNNIILDDYRANEGFWRPELNEDPPNMAALFPYWLATGLFSGLIFAGIYSCVRPCFHGPGWRRGAVYGLCLALIACAFFASWSGVFNLPVKIWIWWAIEAFILFIAGGAALGWVAEKIAPVPA